MNELEEISELIKKGASFEALMQSPTYREGMKEARERLHHQIEETAEGDSDRREQIYLLIRALMVVSATMSSVVSEGIAAEQFLDTQESDDE